MQLQWIDMAGRSRRGVLAGIAPRPLAHGVAVPRLDSVPGRPPATSLVGAPPDATELVASHGSALARGWVWQVPDPIDPSRILWAAHFAAHDTSSDQLLTAMVAALAGQVSRRRGRGLVVAVDADDIETSIALADARLELSCWFRTAETADQPGSSADPDPQRCAEPIEDLPMPHRHGARWALGSPALVRRDAAVALVAPAGPGVLLVDSVVGGTRGDYERALDLVRDEARRLRQARVTVAVGPGEPQLDDLLAEQGFERSVDWWWLGR